MDKASSDKPSISNELHVQRDRGNQFAHPTMGSIAEYLLVARPAFLRIPKTRAGRHQSTQSIQSITASASVSQTQVATSGKYPVQCT